MKARLMYIEGTGTTKLVVSVEEYQKLEQEIKDLKILLKGLKRFCGPTDQNLINKIIGEPELKLS